MKNEILASFRLLVDYARSLTNDIAETDFTAQPHGIANHPAWILGHLCSSMQAMSGERNISPWLPDGWSTAFRTGSMPSSDLANYPTKATLLEVFDQSVQQVEAAVKELTSEQLSLPLPDKEYRRTLPTIGSALLHILISHSSVHIGQLTSWRAAMKLPRVREHFES
jgi:hypothetical protein